MGAMQPVHLPWKHTFLPSQPLARVQDALEFSAHSGWEDAVWEGEEEYCGEGREVEACRIVSAEVSA